VTHLERMFEYKKDVKVAYIYCDYYKASKQTAVNLIASLLQQIVQSETKLLDGINALYEKHRRIQTRPSLADFTRLLQMEAQRFSRVYIVIDAVDEFRDDNTGDSLLSVITKLPKPYVHLLITARPHIRPAGDASILEIRSNRLDIDMYIHSRLQEEHGLKRYVAKDQGLGNKIIARVTELSGGMSVSCYPCLVYLTYLSTGFD
jgi:Cdc6-like AAA superfamily ATPase